MCKNVKVGPTGASAGSMIKTTFSVCENTHTVAALTDMQSERKFRPVVKLTSESVSFYVVVALSYLTNEIIIKGVDSIV